MTTLNIKPPVKFVALAALLALGVASAQPPAAADAADGVPPPPAAKHERPEHPEHRAPGGPEHGKRGGPQGPRGPEMARGPGPDFGHMLAVVNASEEQREQVKKIMRAAFDDGRVQQEALHKLREQSMTLLAAPEVDAAAIEAVRQQTVALQDQLSKRMSDAMVATANVLTPSQRAKLAERMADRKAHMEGGRMEKAHLGDFPKDGGPGRPQ